MCAFELSEAATSTVVVPYSGRYPQCDSTPYDHPLVAVGTSTDLSVVPGMFEHAFPLRMLGDAFALRNHQISGWKSGSGASVRLRPEGPRHPAGPAC